MADEIPTTGLEGASNEGGLPAKAVASVGVSSGNPLPAQSEVPSAAPKTPEVPEPRIIEETIVASPPSAPTPSPPIAKKEELILSTPAPTQDISPPQKTPPSQPAEIPHTAEQFEKEREAISQILKGVKLPERRLETTAPEKRKVFDTTRTAGTARETATVSEPVPPQKETAAGAVSPSDESSGIASTIVSPLRTLKQDLKEIIKVKKISLVRAAALESDKRSHSNILRGEVAQSAHTRRARGILFAALLLVGLGGAALFGMYLISAERSAPVSERGESEILFAEGQVALPLGSLSSLDLKRELSAAREHGNATLGSITQIVPTLTQTSPDGSATERAATLDEFLRALGARPSADLLRALSPQFFFGIHTVDENAPLFVIPVVSYEHAFAGMLAWEGTLNADLAPVFSPVPDQIVGPSGLPEKRRFEDAVMRNYDVRALKDDTSVIQLYYSFPTQHILVIGESPYSFTEVLSRLRAERKL